MFICMTLQNTFSKLNVSLFESNGQYFYCMRRCNSKLDAVSQSGLYIGQHMSDKFNISVIFLRFIVNCNLCVTFFCIRPL